MKKKGSKTKIEGGKLEKYRGQLGKGNFIFLNLFTRNFVRSRFFKFFEYNFEVSTHILTKGAYLFPISSIYSETCKMIGICTEAMEFYYVVVFKAMFHYSIHGMKKNLPFLPHIAQ